MPCAKHLPMAEKWPTHHQNFFGSTIGPRGFQKKNATFLPTSGCYFGHFVKNFGYFGGPKKPKNPKFRPILAKKQHLLKINFHQFFLCFLENIHRNFDDHTTNTGWAISMGGFEPTDRNCLCLAPHGIFFKNAKIQSLHSLVVYQNLHFENQLFDAWSRHFIERKSTLIN